MAEAGKNHFTFVRAPIAIAIDKRHQLRWVREIQFSTSPRQSHREGDAFLKDRDLVESPVAVSVLQARHAAVFREALQPSVEVLTRRFRDIEPAFVVETREHWKTN